MMTPLDELALLLRPAAGGLYLVSTGRAEQLRLQERLYGVQGEAAVQDAFRAALGRIASAKAVMLGVPSDVGAGYMRGSNLGPQAIRTGVVEQAASWHRDVSDRGLVDIGDVFVVPQLLHDSMLSDAQLAATRRALYPNVAPEVAARLPVSPLSITERVWDLVFQLNPRAAPIALGGDHSTALPTVAALVRARPGPLGVVQPDAHTDLLEERLGVKYCYATWSFHANELLGRGGRLVQVGVRASRHPREHWERTYGVRQFWAKDVLRAPEQALDDIVAHLKQVSVRAVYFSNDVDGTDAAFVDATGTPEPDGLHPDFVLELIGRLGREVGLCGGDVMEVAPAVQRTPDGARRTVELAVRYLRATVDGVLAGRT